MLGTHTIVRAQPAVRIARAQPAVRIARAQPAVRIARVQPAVRLACLAVVLVAPLLLLVTPGHTTTHPQPSSPALSSGAPHS